VEVIGIHLSTGRSPVKSTREQLNIIDAYQQLGSYRAAAQLCGISDLTVKRVVERQRTGGPWQRRP
jgi:transposase